MTLSVAQFAKTSNGLSLGSVVGLDFWHMDQLARLVERIDPVRASDHASFARGLWQRSGGSHTIHAADLLPLPFSAEALDVLCANVQQVQERLQQAMLAALFDWRPEGAIYNIAVCTIDTRARGLKAYKFNGHALAHRALQAAFPVLACPPLCGAVRNCRTRPTWLTWRRLNGRCTHRSR